MKIIDAHAHCGCLDRFPRQDLGDYISCLGNSGIKGAIMFSPVMEIYDRYNPDFTDTESWRRRRASSNEYLLSAGAPGFEVFPFFFIWNDFAVEQLTEEHKGIKWHRHPDEPVYNYNDARCSAALEVIRRRRLPVCLEEEFTNTLSFINDLGKDIRVIIPHCGMLNGGYGSLQRAGVWENPNVWTDTALAPAGDIMDYVSRHGHDRIMFGSDFPFGDPAGEFTRILRLRLNDSQKEAIISSNVQRLLDESKRP